MRTAGRRRGKGGCREQEGVTPGGNLPLCSQEGEGGGDFAFSRYGDPERIEEEWLMELPWKGEERAGKCLCVGYGKRKEAEALRVTALFPSAWARGPIEGGRPLPVLCHLRCGCSGGRWKEEQWNKNNPASLFPIAPPPFICCKAPLPSLPLAVLLRPFLSVALLSFFPFPFSTFPAFVPL